MTQGSYQVTIHDVHKLIFFSKNLTWRDVQHLIINTSSVAGLEGYDRVVANSAGYICEYILTKLL